MSKAAVYPSVPISHCAAQAVYSRIYMNRQKIARFERLLVIWTPRMRFSSPNCVLATETRLLSVEFTW